MVYNDFQKRVISHRDGNLAVLASAGSGKSAVIVQRIKDVISEGIPPEQILAISFSKKACENLQARLKSTGKVDISTFHALALRIVQQVSDNRYKLWTTQWEKEKAICDIVLGMKLEWSSKKVNTGKILAYINIQKVNMLKPSDTLIAVNDMPYPADKMQKIYTEFETYKSQHDYIEFNDLVPLACDMFEIDEDLVETYKNKYKYVFVDEFQDVSKDQFIFLKYICNNNLMAVGDILQNIYTFRGADSTYLSKFDELWCNASVYNLPTNYRCSADIVHASNVLAKHMSESTNKHYLEAVADKDKCVVPKIYKFKEQTKENEFIANIISNHALINGDYEFKDFAILARCNAQLSPIQKVLSDNGIPFEVVGGNTYYDLPEIKILIEYMRLAKNTDNNTAFCYVFNRPNRFLPNKLLDEIRDNATDSYFTETKRYTSGRYRAGIIELRSIIENIRKRRFDNVAEIIKYIRAELDIDSFVQRGINADLESLSEVKNNIDFFQESCIKHKTIDSLLYYVDNFLKNQDNKKDKNKVKLMTIHKSKGLEFPVVFVVGCSDGLLPHSKSSDTNDEKRLFYVAMTRAEKELYMTHSDVGNNNIFEPSPFLNDILEVCSVFEYNSESNGEKNDK